MSRPSRNRRAGLAAGLMAGAIISGGLAAPVKVLAAAEPLVMGPLYVEPKRSDKTPAPPDAGGCPVRIVELTDSRRDPQTVGSLLTERAIAAPTDREAWLRSVFGIGLAARGFKPSFEAGEAAAPGAVVVRVRLRTLWVGLIQMNKTGSVALQVSAASAGAGDGAARLYRGDKTSLSMWGSASEFNGLVNQVFAEALDGLAADLRPLCSAGAGGPAAAQT
jgi:hypothetical protein